MGLLQKRPLALFCVCFLAALNVSVYLPVKIKPIVLGVIGAIAVGVLLFSILHSRRRTVWIALLLCVLSVGGALLHTYVRLDLREREALSYTGNRTVECQILSVERKNDDRTECIAELLQIGEERTRICTYLICGFSAELHEGDRVLARVELTETDETAYGVCANERTSDSRILLSTVWHDAERGALLSCGEQRSAWALLREPNGAELLSNRMRAATANAFDRALGSEQGALARSFFIGDKDGLSPRTELDFRRTGTLHLLAVSGLHVAVLLGGLEWILRKLTLPKLLRILAVSLAGLLLLAMTGFSMSACRSVLMLYAVYLHYLFATENDPLTSLLVSVTVILLLSPDAFFDLGLWMSFYATLGLVTLYPPLDAHVPRKLFSTWPLQFLWRCLRAALMTAVMTLVTTLFLLPTYASVFGEISLVTIPANVLLGPIGVLYLYVIPIAVLLSPMPIVGDAARLLLGGLGEAMTEILAFFSEQNGAVLSLRYRFVDVIVPILMVLMTVLLLVRLRRKLWLCIPPIAAVLCFTVCLLITYRSEPPLVSDYTNSDARLLTLSDDGKGMVIDLSCTESAAYFDGVASLRKQGVTDVDVLVLGHLSEEHPDMIEDLLPYAVVHRICLPRKLAEQNPALAYEIGDVAEAMGCEVLLYAENTPFILFDDSFAVAALDGEGTRIAGLSVLCDGARLTYADLSRLPADSQEIWVDYACESHTALIDAALCDGKSSVGFVSLSGTPRQLVLRPLHEHACVAVQENGMACYSYPIDTKKRMLSFWIEP